MLDDLNSHLYLCSIHKYVCHELKFLYTSLQDWYWYHTLVMTTSSIHVISNSLIVYDSIYGTYINIINQLLPMDSLAHN